MLLAHLGHFKGALVQLEAVPAALTIDDVVAAVTFLREPRRLQLQERLTSQIADTLMEELQPAGVAVMGSAEHLCMTMRGVKKPGKPLRSGFTRFSTRRSQMLLRSAAAAVR